MNENMFLRGEYRYDWSDCAVFEHNNKRRLLSHQSTSDCRGRLHLHKDEMTGCAHRLSIRRNQDGTKMASGNAPRRFYCVCVCCSGTECEDHTHWPADGRLLCAG